MWWEWILYTILILLGIVAVPQYVCILARAITYGVLAERHNWKMSNGEKPTTESGEQAPR